MKEEIGEIEEDKQRFVGALCNAGYCKTLLEAEQEVQDFVDKILKQPRKK